MSGSDEIIKNYKDEEILDIKIDNTSKNEVIYIVRELIKAITSTLSLQKISKRVYLYMRSKYGECTFGIAVNYPDRQVISDCFYYENDDVLSFDPIKYSEGTENSKLLKAVLERKEHILDCSKPESNVVYHGVLPKASYFAPLIMKGQVIGAFTYQSHDRTKFSDEEIKICTEIRPFLSIALNNSLQTQKLIELNKKLERLSTYDTLTEIYNRRYFYEVFDKKYKKSMTEGSSSYLFLMDLDKFKEVNDNFGHQIGDVALKRIAKILENIFSDGVIGRYGGDEFIAGITDIDENDLVDLVDKIDSEISKLNILVDKKGDTLSISKGILKLTTGKSLREYFVIVDENLYRSKARKDKSYYLSEV